MKVLSLHRILRQALSAEREEGQEAAVAAVAAVAAESSAKHRETAFAHRLFLSYSDVEHRAEIFCKIYFLSRRYL